MRKEGRFPHMELLALEWLAIPATEASSERVFSKGGRLAGGHRSGSGLVKPRTFLGTSLEALAGLGKRPRSA